MGALSLLTINGCSSDVKNDAATDKKMREAIAHPLKISDLPVEAQKIMQSNSGVKR